ncbi:hypothetical protein HaLaN_20929 [Haematococcus lacustris]|uniref:Uncharacterized protein n=1 Tax=Haematococcus lacustris TaxID=44745 RepID=A0A699ZQ85_HAELA|nr:hypothetical protein HaLaN_20929 [Haematococcus lacustris]
MGPWMLARFDEAVAGRLEGERESTDACNRLSHLLKALAKVPHQVGQGRKAKPSCITRAPYCPH